MVIANDTVRKDVWSELKSGLGTALGTSFIVTSAYNDRLSSSFDNYLIINPVQVSERALVMNRSVKTQPIVVSLDVYTKKNQTLDEASDIINSWFSDNESYLGDLGLENLNYIDNPAGDFIDVNDNKLHVKTVAINFERDKVK